ncbi:hypothetical protein VS893_24235, partial [Shigella flexneri]
MVVSAIASTPQFFGIFYLVTRVCGFANGYFRVRTSEPVRGNVFL